MFRRDVVECLSMVEGSKIIRTGLSLVPTTNFRGRLATVIGEIFAPTAPPGFGGRSSAMDSASKSMLKQFGMVPVIGMVPVVGQV